MDADESRVVEETLGANADTENGLCQFITIPFTDPLIKKHFPSSFLPNNKTASVLCHWQHSPGTINSLSYHHHCFTITVPKVVHDIWEFCVSHFTDTPDLGTIPSSHKSH